MTADEIGGDQCITPEFDDPVPPRCQRDDCDDVDCAQCFQLNRAACAGATWLAFEQVR
jgi:hypothetical protein